MGVGASVRLVEGSNGIRFASTFSKSLIDFVNSNKDVGTAVKYGTIIMPTNNIVEGFGFTLNELNIIGKEEGKDYVNIEAVDSITSGGAGGVKISSALVNINEENFALELSAISYLRYTKDGRDVYIYSVYNSENNSRSISYVAQKALEDLTDSNNSAYKYEVTVEGNVKYSRYTDAQRAILNGYLAK